MKLTTFPLTLLPVVVFRCVDVSAFALYPTGKSVRFRLASISLPAQKKRKRKQPPAEPESAMEVPSASLQGLVDAQENVLSDDEVAVMKDVANFEFKPESFIPIGMFDASFLGCMALSPLTLIDL